MANTLYNFSSDTMDRTIGSILKRVDAVIEIEVVIKNSAQKIEIRAPLGNGHIFRKNLAEFQTYNFE